MFRNHRRAWSLVFWACALANAVPLLSTRYLPFTDTPQHTAAMATLARLMPGGGGAPYRVALGQSQYLLFHAVGAVLTRIVGDALLANSMLLVIVVVAWPLAMRALLRAMGRDERLAIFAGMVFWNRATMTGLEPYIASVPLLLFSVAVFVRQRAEPTVRRGVFLAVLSLALFYAHASSFLLFGVIAFAIVASSWKGLRAALVEATPLVPSLLIALAWARAGTLKTSGEGAIERMPVIESLLAMPIWTFDVWSSHVDEVAAALWWIAYAGIVITSWRRTSDDRPEWRAWLPFACALLMYLTIPARIGDAGMLNVRIAPLLALFALIGLRIEAHRLGHLPIGVAVFATFLNAGSSVFEVRQVKREVAGELDVVLAAMKPGTSVALLNFVKESPRTHHWPYPFAGAYHLARGGAVASFSFAELPHWSVHYGDNAAPPPHAPFWAFDPCQYRFRSDGRFYDYVLVQGDPTRFERGLRFGPAFDRVARSGRFTLYEKSSVVLSEPADDRRDIGPCAREVQ